MQTLKNEFLTLRIKRDGAELASVVNNKSGIEYLWQANPRFWKRHSPVLFPIVGSLWNGEFHYEGKSYKMSQHGFARDMAFDLIEETATSVSYLLKSNEDTQQRYPFDFELEIGYELKANSVLVKWKVRNNGDKMLYFQIGAHPAFYYPDFNEDEEERGYFSFDKKNEIEYTVIKEKGCVDPAVVHKLVTDSDGVLLIDTHTFDIDTFIIEKGQIKKVGLLTKNKKPYLTLHFDAPVVGLWSPKDRACPFVCIEPWFGRCDRVDYIGDISGRDYMNSLNIGEEFSASYTIEITID